MPSTAYNARHLNFARGTPHETVNTSCFLQVLLRARRGRKAERCRRGFVKGVGSGEHAADLIKVTLQRVDGKASKTESFTP